MNIKSISLLVVLSTLLLVQSCSALYFELNGGTTKCFIEENPKDTLLVGNYVLEDLNPQAGISTPLALSVIVTDPENHEVLSKQMGASGRFAFQTLIGGEYKICISTNSSKWFGPTIKTRLHLDIQVGANANDYEEIAKVEQLNNLEISVKRLNDRVTQVRKEQSYQKAREITFRNTSESTNSRVMWWAILQVVVLCLTGMWQMRHLKSFFKAKKLV
ncbi:emp24/gp25L/p24 family protein [Heterostelium album PN500]|uniref:Emp24/gp25L/p24 family protein n=1 Tax=Heterostelium pallidum (strain ATCC 26659 / Pp 5 / PN500) TaxID=670386 RepID=D3BFU7_HETP5|nr:emp24/gp25L/p24 family protein [Heterostelium album PN500]EFA79707.1 emp24/gp25L/p24 family protein [Heterostelium album PN500]|eukprot:XP_020431828.1 emp24/gp25L/p24 family protein [Heterostelium album PN500]